MLLAACAKAPVSGDLSVVPTGDGAFRIEDTAAAAPLTGDATDLGSVSVAGERVTFRTVSSESRRVADAFGRGICFVYKGESVDGPALTRELRLSFYDAFPSTMLVSASYRNASSGGAR